ncbi:MAG: aspartyl-phosphate phosphatase Spo0E family protein [Eubacterium sp.]|nr:aspartyl-phosphate phosphatase Spo0E family protein [Eubacterium sp.]
MRKMNKEFTLRMEIEQLRKELNKAAARDLSSEECFRLSLKLDQLLERYYNAGGSMLI